MKSSEKPADAESPKAEASPAEDVMLVHGVSHDGEGLAVVRKRQDRLELGAVHPLKEGKAIHGEVVRLKPRSECPLVCDVEVCLPKNATETAEAQSRASEARAPAGHKKGPAQVASASYRENWDRIWKRRTKRELVN